MPTDRKFCRFAPTDRPLQTREIPEGGICLSAFVVLSESGHRDRILMGHLDPSAGWDHIGQHPAWTELAFVDVNETPREEISRYHDDILANVGRWNPASR